MGGRPSKGTPKDRRLAVNKPAPTSKPAAKKTAMPKMPRKGGK